MFLSKVWCRSWLPANSRVDLIFKFIEFVSSCEFCVWSKFRFRRESKWISDNSRYLKWPWIENSMSMVSNSELSCLFFQSLNYIEFIKWCQEFSVTKYKSTNLMNSIFIMHSKIKCKQEWVPWFLTIGAELGMGESITDDWFTSHEEDVLFIFALGAHGDSSQ